MPNLKCLSDKVSNKATRTYLMPHQGTAQDAPIGLDPPEMDQPIRYRKVLGGIIRDYYRAAA